MEVRCREHPDEVWRDVPGFPEYQAGDQGCIRSLKRAGRILRPGVNKSAGGKHGSIYTQHIVCLMKDGKRVMKSVHLLVLAAHVGPLPQGKETRHINGDSLDNRLTNLVYGTKSENAHDTVRHGRHNKQRVMV